MSILTFKEMGWVRLSICAAILTLTVYAQFGRPLWPFIPYDMFSNVAEKRFSVIALEVPQPDGSRRALNLQKTVAPFRHSEIQKLLRKYNRMADWPSFCQRIKSRLSTGIEINRLTWDLNSPQLSEPRRQRLSECSI